MGTVLKSYAEQIQTTFETMRRRGLVAYDAGARWVLMAEKFRKNLPKQLVTLSKDGSLKKVYDGIGDQKALDADNKQKRNNLQELYFGVSVLVIALCAGQMTGILWSASILSSIFDPSIELLIVCLLPIYCYLHLKKRKAYDTIERRSWLFAFVFAICVLLGDLLGARLISTVPSLFFFAPFVLALMIDVEFSPSSLYANRTRLLIAVTVGSFLSMQSFAVFTGMSSVASFLCFLLLCGMTAVHFQVVEPRIENDDFEKSLAQLFYVLAILVFQLPLALLLG